MTDEEQSVREKVRDKADNVNPDVLGTAREIKREAENSIRDFEMNLDSKPGGLQLRIEGKLNDLKSFQKDFNEIVGDRGVRVHTEADFDVNLDGALVVELIDSSEPSKDTTE